MKIMKPYIPKNKIRIVTAASLFDGHDAAINIMRRIIQSTGVEVIHLGHDRSVEEVVNTAIQEDANAIAMTSYQGGHNEYFKYMYDLLQEKGGAHIRIFGGGGGVILPKEIEDLMAYGITRIYSPDDGRHMGLQGMINDMIEHCDYDPSLLPEKKGDINKQLKANDKPVIARLISLAENHPEVFHSKFKELHKVGSDTPVLGITGTGGAGKSSLVDELVRRFLSDFPSKKIGIISVDPSKRKTGGALLGDRIRMNSVNNDRVYMRSLATRQSNLALSKHVNEAVNILKAASFDLIVLETSGIGQSDTEILDHSDFSLYVMTPEYGAATQLEKIDMLDFANVIALNKFDKKGGLDALRDVKKQFQRNHQFWDVPVDSMPVFGTIASQFNDPGTNNLYKHIIDKLNETTNKSFVTSMEVSADLSEKLFIIPPKRVRYLSEISDTNVQYDQWSKDQSALAQKLYGIYLTLQSLSGKTIHLDANGLDLSHAEEAADKETRSLIERLLLEFKTTKMNLTPHNWEHIIGFEAKKQAYQNEIYKFKVRNKVIEIETHATSLSHLKIPKISLPKYKAWGDLLLWILQENLAGEFPFTAGIYPFKRTGEDPTRMFAGEGGPERTNRRFHYVSLNSPAKRLSTAFDSVTLYGHDPDHRPDIYGKIGNAGVSVCCLDDAKKLYSGFELTNPMTSVSMTINGPAPMLLGFFMNAAIDQECEKYITDHNLQEEVERKIKAIYKDKGVSRPSYQGETSGRQQWAWIDAAWGYWRSSTAS